MDIQESYGKWSAQYDSNRNRTRDMEAKVLRAILKDISFDSCLEIGCGTGKNSIWLAERTKNLCAVDLTPEMLAIATGKLNAANVQFVQADIREPWLFRKELYDLVSFSLVLEHIEDLDFIFKEAAASLLSGGHIYIGELHPFKQYSGSKARFETETGTHTIQCFDHHVTDFIDPGNKHGFELVSLKEYFDEDNRNGIPRLLVLLFRKR